MWCYQFWHSFSIEIITGRFFVARRVVYNSWFAVSCVGNSGKLQKAAGRICWNDKQVLKEEERSSETYLAIVEKHIGLQQDPADILYVTTFPSLQTLGHDETTKQTDHTIESTTRSLLEQARLFEFLWTCVLEHVIYNEMSFVVYI